MIARLAKTANEAARDPVAAAFPEQTLKELNVADAAGVLIAADATPHAARPHRRTSRPASSELDRLYLALEAVTPESNPRTARLLRSSNRKVAQKVIEEAGEVALAAVKHNGRNIVRESADLLYQLVVLWHRAGLAPRDIWAEMRRRADALGIAEKLPKSLPGR